MENLPQETLVYLLGSRYCDTDNLSTVAWNLFGTTARGWSRVQAVCNFVNRHITSAMSSRAPPVNRSPKHLCEQKGVCRDSGTTSRSRYVDV